MSTMSEFNLAALRSYANELETFIARINRYCTDLETGIGSCSKYMRDENSQKALQKGRKIAEDIKACIYPTQMILERVRMIIAIMEREISRSI